MEEHNSVLGKCLVEVLIVLVISGSLIIGTHFHYRKLKAIVELKLARDAITATLRFVRQEAIVLGHNREITVGAKRIEESAGGHTVLQVPGSVSITEARFGRLSGSFSNFMARANGTVSPGRIHVQSTTGKSCLILISLRGAMRSVCD